MADPLTIGVMVASTALTAYSQVQAGNAAEAQAEAIAQQNEYQAKVQRQRAGQERASSQRQVIEENRNKETVQGNALASAAASGGGTLDPSVIDIFGDLEAEGEYRKNVARYQGEDSAQYLESGANLSDYSASNARAEGKAAKKASRFKAGTTLLKGGVSMYDKYGGSFENMSGQSSALDPRIHSNSMAIGRKPIGSYG